MAVTITMGYLPTLGCDWHGDGESTSASSGLNAAGSPQRSPKDQIEFVFHTLPDAVCTLHWANPDGPSTALYSDDDGEVRFFLGGGAGGVSPPHELSDSLHLDCRDDEGRTDNNLVDPRNPEPASHVSGLPESPPVIRAALTGDPMALSQEELITRGFPPRPDRTKDAPAFSAWLDLVSLPARVVSPRLVHSCLAPKSM
jgi:hypothetical protein